MDINGKTSIGLSPQKRKCKEWKKKTEQIFLSGRSFKKRSISYIKKKGIYPRHPIFINLKSNTMKTQCKDKEFYVIKHNNTTTIRF